MAQDRTMKNLAATPTRYRGPRRATWKTSLLTLALLVAGLAAFVGVWSARQAAWERQCEQLVPASDHNAMDVCTQYGPGALHGN